MGIAPGSPAYPVPPQLQEARRLLQERRFAEALTLLASIDLSHDPEKALLEGGAALGLGALPRAISCLRVSLDARPSVDASLNLATALDASGDLQGALDAVGEGLRAFPDEPVLLACHYRLSPPHGEHARLAQPDHTPARSLRIVFWQPRSIPFDATTSRSRGLGGTESAVAYLAEALAARGHQVTVLNNCPAPGLFGTVEYGRWEEMPKRCATAPPDVLVAVRHWPTIAHNRFAPLQIFWTGDAYDQPFLEGLEAPAAHSAIDVFVAISAWQAETFREHRNVEPWRTFQLPYGTAPCDDHAPAPAGPRPRRLAYSSTPFRGLDVLLSVFPRIRAACPDAELHVFSSMRVYGVSADDDRRQFGALYQMADQPGVVLAGTVSQPALADAWRQMRIMAYPNTFPETFCIAAAEAMAAGCPVVTSALGALPETLGEGGVCVAGDPHTASYQQRFVEQCVSLLMDETRWQMFSARASARAAARYRWPEIACAWETLMKGAVEPTPSVVQRAVMHVRAGRGGLAGRMLERESRPSSIEADAWAALIRLARWQAGQGPSPSTDEFRLLVGRVSVLRGLPDLDRWAREAE